MNDHMASDPAREDVLILVDSLDRKIGAASKEQAHREGLLHRAFSVVLTREGVEGTEILLTKRAEGKYHSGGLWTNSCCSHPRMGEQLPEAAYRRVHEELGCEAADLQEIASFSYRAVFENGICEYEYDHVLVGRFAGELACDPAEVEAVRWISVDALAIELAKKPELFTAWSPMVLSIALAEIQRV